MSELNDMGDVSGMSGRPGAGINRMKGKPRVLTFTITGAEAGMTVRTFLREKLQFSGHQISRLKYQEEGIRIDGRRVYVTHVLSEGETLTVGLTKQVIRRSTEGGRTARVWESPAALLDEMPLQILYEDEDLIIVNKPAGIVVHPSPGHYSDTLANQVAAHLGAIGTELDIRVTGRLDRETSGIVTFAQNTETAGMIQRQRAEGKLVKTYIALAEGHFSQKSGVIDAPLRRGSSGVINTPLRGEESREVDSLLGGGRFGKADSFLWRESPNNPQDDYVDGKGQVGSDAWHHKTDEAGRTAEDKRMTVAADGRPARTHYRVLQETTGLDGQPRTLLMCRIEHGRTHQIRVHMAHIGHPLVGDSLYGADTGEAPHEKKRNQEPMGLHAWKLALDQPFTGRRIEVEAALPGWAQFFDIEIRA